MKVPEPKKLPSGAYHLQLRLGGESISITRRTANECKQEAQVIKAEYLAGRRDLRYRKTGEMTLAEVQEEYLKQRRPVLSPATVKGYEQMASARFSGYRGKALGKIKWQDMINDELSVVSEKTVKNAWGLVTASLREAGYPVPDVKLPSVPVNEIAFLQPDEIGRFCDAIQGKPYEIALLLMLHGLRQSEVRGLTWDNVDLKRGVLRIRGSVVKGPDGFVEKKTNKNRTSSRDLPLMIPRLFDALSAVTVKEGPVVTLHPSVLLRDVKRSCLKAGVTVVSCHGLRHSFASLCYHLNVPERRLMQWGGWADIQTMHKIYIRLAAADESKELEKVRGFFAYGNAHDGENVQ